MKKIRTIFFLFLVSTVSFFIHASVDDLFSEDEYESFQISNPVYEKKMHPIWDAPTYIKIGYYYFYYTYMKPIYLAVIAYMHQKNKKLSHRHI